MNIDRIDDSHSQGFRYIGDAVDSKHDKGMHSFSLDYKTTIKGSVSGHNDNDYYKFTATYNGPISFNLTDLTGNAYLRLYDGSGNELRANPPDNWNNSKDKKLFHSIEKGEDYIIKIDPYGNATSKYTLTITNPYYSIDNGSSYSDTRPNLTVYRPQYGIDTHYENNSGIYFEWEDIKIPEWLEFKEKEGPGIRINSQNDKNEESQYLENDLIRVDIENLPDGGVLTRSHSDLKLYNNPFGLGYELDFNYNNEFYLDSLSETKTLWAEWTGGTDEKPTLELKSHNGKSDQIKFHPFKNMVVVIAGENQEPYKPIIIGKDGANTADKNGNYFNAEEDDYGLAQLSLDLLNKGYDVHFIEEPDGLGYTDMSRDNPSFWQNKQFFWNAESYNSIINEITDAANHRSVTEFAMIGYSHGGGSVYDISEELISSNTPLPDGFSFDFTAYVDAVSQDAWSGTGAQQDAPENSVYHLNIYQTSGFLDGVAISSSSYLIVNNIDADGLKVTHSTIDNNEQVIDLLIAGVVEHVGIT